MKKLLVCVALIAALALLALGAAAEAGEGELSGVLSVEGFRSAGFDFAEVREIQFSDALESRPRGAWDVSAAGDGSVWAWLEAGELTIAAEGGVKAPADCAGLFEGFSALRVVEFHGSFDTGACENMHAMFKGCPELDYLRMGEIDTSNVTDMSEMFEGCAKFGLLLEPFDTRSVMTFEGMFRGCEGLFSIYDLGLDTSGATNLREMFAGCSTLHNLNGAHFDTAKVETMERMFLGCGSMEELDLSEATLTEDMALDSAFAGCVALRRLYVGDSFAALGVEKRAGMLADCTAEVIPIGSAALSPGVLRREDALSYKVLGGSRAREDVRSIRFSDDIAQAPEDAWDVSALGDGSVLAWFEDESGCEDLVIAADGGVRANPVSDELFALYKGVEEIRFDGCFDTSLCRSMAEMFRGCGALRTLDLSGLDTSRVLNMYCMFDGCGSLEALDLTPLDTSSVQNMFAMFGDCESLRSLDISRLDTSSAENIARMFIRCNSLEELDLSHLDTSSATEMYGLFEECANLRRVNVSGLDASHADSLIGMFMYCEKLEEVDLTGMDTSGVSNMACMFQGCASLRELDLTTLDTRRVERMQEMFAECPALCVLRLGENFAFDSLLYHDDMFSGTYPRVIWEENVPANVHGNTLMRDVPSDAEIEGGEGRVLEMGLHRWSVRSITFLDDTSAAPEDAWDASATGTGSVLAWTEEDGDGYDLYIAGDGGVWANPDSSYLFHGYLSLEEIHFNGCFHTEQATNMAGMFEWCASLTALDLSGFDTSRVERMAAMFFGCTGLRELNLSGLDTARVEDMSHMFCACGGLTELDVTGFDTSRVKRMEGMFSATGVKRLDLRGFDTAQVESMDMMFLQSDALEEILAGEGFAIGENTSTEEMFTGCPAGGLTVTGD